MKVIQIVPRLITASSGPSQSVPALANSLEAAGAEVELNVLAPVAGVSVGVPLRTHANLFGRPFDRLGVSPALCGYLRVAASKYHIMHTHGLWMMPNIYPYSACAGKACRTVLSPRGTLDPWALTRSRAKKRIAALLGQRHALEGADLIHVTSEEELRNVRDFGLTQPVAVVSNGVEAPEQTITPSPGSTRKDRTLLFLSRLHEKKGLDMLLAAWAKLAPALPKWVLHVAGPIDSEWARTLREDYESSHCRFLGEVSGATKWRALAQADALVLPSHGENFGMAVAEALATGTPVVVSDRMPWADVVERGCGWIIEPNESSIVAVLREVCAEPPRALEAAGERGRIWMRESFGWQRVGQDMLAAYRWLVDGGSKPIFVDTVSGGNDRR